MLVRVLGEVSLLSRDGTVVPLPGSRQPALLAALAARAHQVVSADLLVELLWGESPPENPTAALYSAVFKLRANLARVGGREVLLTRGRGYRLDLRPGDLDADTFTALVSRAREEPPGSAADTLRDALALWHGPAYGSVADTEVAHLDSLRLEEIRCEAVEQHAQALLASGRPGEAVAALQPFLAEHPLREAARITLMQALHATGRTTEALDHFHVHRRFLADELGLEPSYALKEAQADLLRDDAGGPATPLRARDDLPRGLPGLRIRYLHTAKGNVIAHGTVGEGPPLVVLLGWVSSLDVIASGRDPRSSLLERLAGQLSLTLYDREGSGLSPSLAPDYGLEASVAELTEVVGEIGPPVSLLAMSSCGPVALAMAHRRPEWVDSLVLFGTFADGPASFPDKRLRDMVLEIVRSHWTIGSKVLANLYRPGVGHEAAWHLAKALRDSASPEVAVGYLETIYDQDVSDLLPQVRTPTLVLHYRDDRLIPFRSGRLMASRLPDATFLPLEGEVHLPDAADLDAIQEAVVEHVRRHVSRAPTGVSGRRGRASSAPRGPAA